MASEMHTNGLDVLYTSIALLCQTMFYGIYAVLIPFSTHVLLKRGLRTRADAFMCGLTIFMFTLATAYWVASVANLVIKIKTFFITPNGLPSENTFADVFNALILINYVLTDSVVLWRAWVLCRDDSSKILIIPSILLVLTAVSVATTVGIRIALTVLQNGHLLGSYSPLNRAIDISQVATLILSSLTNIVATCIISVKAWRHRQLIKDGLKRSRDKSTLVGRVFALLIESGILYCISGLTVVVATVIRLPHGTVGDIYTPVNVQLAGIYPTIVLVLVSMQQTMDETAFCTTSDITHLEAQNGRVEAGKFSHKVRSRISTIQFSKRQDVHEENSSCETGSEDDGFGEPINKESDDRPALPFV